MSRNYGAQSEHRPLRRLLLHRPEPDHLRWVTRERLEYFGFAAPVDPDRFLTQYDQMVSAFAAQGVEILFLAEVLAGHTEALGYVARRPNLVYMRDMATVYDHGAVVMNPHLPGRQWDGWVVAEAFRRLGIPVLGTIRYPGYLEGGGNTFLTERTGLVSLCDRTSEAGIEQLARATLGRCLDELLVVNLPPGHIHIDGLLMVAGPDLVFVHEPTLEIAPTRLLRADGSVRHLWLLEHLRERGLEVIPGAPHQDMNFVAVREGLLVGCAHARAHVPLLEERGYRVVGLPGDELVKGKGGVHCKTCPVLRG